VTDRTEPAADERPAVVPASDERPAVVPGADERPAAVVPKQGFDRADDDRPLPDLPPLPKDPRWRVEHLPFLSAVMVAALLCAASIGYFNGGAPVALGAAAGVAITAVSYTMSTLVIAWADTVRPALVMPLGMATYVIKYTLLGVILAFSVTSDWAGKSALGWGVVAGVLVWTAVQVWWVHGRRAAK
jgi:hypothetical protein